MSVDIHVRRRCHRFQFLAESNVPVWYLKPGETIFKEGEPAKELYVIQSGQVEIQVGNRLLDTL